MLATIIQTGQMLNETCISTKNALIVLRPVAAHFDFTSFLPSPFFNSWPLLFYSQGVFVTYM